MTYSLKLFEVFLRVNRITLKLSEAFSYGYYLLIGCNALGQQQRCYGRTDS